MNESNNYFLKGLILLLCSFLMGCFGNRQANKSFLAPKAPANPNYNIYVSSKILSNQESVRVYLQIDASRLHQEGDASKFVEEFTIQYILKESFESFEVLASGEIQTNAASVQKIGNQHFLYFDLPKQGVSQGALNIALSDNKTGQSVFYQVVLNYAVTKINQEYSFFRTQDDFPYFQSYFNVKDTFSIQNPSKSSKNLLVDFYKAGFIPAESPMNLFASQSQKQMMPDSSFSIKTNEALNFYSPGFYFIKEDERDYYGISLFVSASNYPKLTKIWDVVEPLVYITTEEELATIKDAENYESAKAEMDRLWLGWMGGNTGTAKRMIKKYFERVKIANQIFTSHKEGWKTDLGMVFIVMGTPTQTRQVENKVIWTYNDNPNFSEVNFTFERKAGQFSDLDYQLIRYPEYEQIWYPAIETWREGKITN